MVIPANALPKVMGKGGTNVDNIRKVGLGVAITIIIALYCYHEDCFKACHHLTGHNGLGVPLLGSCEP